MGNKCDNLSLYIVGELSDAEKKQFENHMETCVDCRKEAASLRNMWEMLSYDVEEAEVPETLKAEVMDFVFRQDQPAPKHKLTFSDKVKNLYGRHFSPISIGVVFALMLGLGGLAWSNHQLKETITAMENTRITTTQIVKTFTLKGQNLAASAKGNAFLLQEGKDASIVIELKNLPGIEPKEVYQVWLLKNGSRHNAGTLKPDENGNGHLSYRLPRDYRFDDIGITLEPNSTNTEPMGQKVIGTAET